MIKQKKGIMLHEAIGAVLMVVAVAVLIIIALVLFSSINTSFLSGSGGIANSTANETISAPTDTGIRLARNTDSTCGTISQMLNGTSGNVAIGSGNWTQSGCTLTNTTSYVTMGYASSWRASYNFTYHPEVAASNTVITNFSNYPALVGLVGTIIFLGIVIGVLVASFAFGGGNKA